MNNVNHKKKALINSIIWFLSLQIIGYFTSGQINVLEKPVLTPLSIYWVGVSVYVIFFSCPLLFSIKHHANQANLKPISFIATVLLLQHGLWVILTVVELVRSLF